MRLHPTIGNRAMHRRAVLGDVATGLQECMVDRADLQSPGVIGL